MPASKTLSAYYIFSTGTAIRSAQVNNNFDLLRGHLIPLDPNTIATSDFVYDVGGETERFVNGWYGGIQYSMYSSTPAAPPAGFMKLYAKDDGGIYKKDSAGNETSVGGGGGVVIFAASAPIVNGVAVATTLLAALVMTNTYTSWEFKYKAYRRTDSEERLELGVLTGGYKTVAAIWASERRTDFGDDAMGDQFAGFTVNTATGSIMHTCDSMAGANYTGTSYFELVRKF
jgi:hypothetical protein